MVRRWTQALLLCGAIFLTACGPQQGVVMTLDGQTALTSDQVEKAVPFFDLSLNGGKERWQTVTAEEDNRTEVRALYRRTAEQLAMDFLIAKDDTLVFDANAAYALARAEAADRFGGEAGLSEQLKNFGIAPAVFEDSLRLEAVADAHRKAFLASQPTTTEEVSKYFEQHPTEASLVTYTQITVPTRAEAQEIEEKLRQDPKAAGAYENTLNNDLFEKTSYARYTDMSYHDEAVFDTDLFSQDIGSVDFYYRSSDRTYAVVMMEGRKNTPADVGEKAVQLVDEARYLEYLNALAKDHHYRFYPEEIVVPQVPAQSSASSAE